MRKEIFLAAGVALMLAGCSSMKVWPFDDDKPHLTGQPANSTEFMCEGGKHFYVRYMDNGNTAWVIYPDREVALSKEASGSRYSNGVAVLEIKGNEATLNDGPGVSYTGCKTPAATSK